MLNVGISGPGVARAIVPQHPDYGLTALIDVIRRAVSKITRAGGMVGRELTQRLGVSFEVVDISQRPPP
ncbi:hypothetical protein DFAR_3300002 [Desulfarculales bacterium]